MSHVRVVIRLALGLANVLHDLMLALSRDLVTRQDDFASLPINVFGYLLRDEVLELLRQARHKLGTWGNAIRVERVLLRHLFPFSNRLVPRCFGVQRGSKTAGALLVHLRPRCDTVNGHEEELLRLDLPEQMLDIVEYLDEHLVFGQTLGGGGVGVIVGTVVNDAVHVQVKTVELGDTILGDELRDGRVALGEPTKELGDTCSTLILTERAVRQVKAGSPIVAAAAAANQRLPQK